MTVRETYCWSWSGSSLWSLGLVWGFKLGSGTGLKLAGTAPWYSYLPQLDINTTRTTGRKYWEGGGSIARRHCFHVYNMITRRHSSYMSWFTLPCVSSGGRAHQGGDLTFVAFSQNLTMSVLRRPSQSSCCYYQYDYDRGKILCIFGTTVQVRSYLIRNGISQILFDSLYCLRRMTGKKQN